MPVEIYQERKFYRTYCKSFEQISTKISICEYLDWIPKSEDE